MISLDYAVVARTGISFDILATNDHRFNSTPCSLYIRLSSKGICSTQASYAFNISLIEH